MLVELAVDIPQLGVRTFHYSLPPELQDVTLGSALLVPFSGRMAVGYTVGFPEQTDLPEILSVSDLLESPPVPLELLELCRWVAEYYVAPLAESLRLALPPGGGRHLVKELALTEKGKEALDCAGLPEEETAALLQLAESFPDGMAASGITLSPAALRRLVSGGSICVRYGLKRPRIRVKQALCVALTDEGARQDCGALPKAQGRLMEVLQEECDMPAGDLLKRAQASQGSLAGLAAKGLITMERRIISRAKNSPAAHPHGPGKGHQLSEEQSRALSVISEALTPASEDPAKVFLLHGVTASGKTEVYMRAIEKALELGRSALVLVPEIALTPQTCTRFQRRFGRDVAVLHSGLALGRRYDEWHHIAAGERRVVVGTRSALFAPVRKLGLIIIDEEQETSYKQDRAPRYHARTVAEKRAQLTGSVLVYGSATPSLEARTMTGKGQAVELALPRRIEDRPFPEVEVVDLRRETRRSLLSQPLADALKQTAGEGGKAMILLNRRGFASFLLCRDCGHVPGCPHCSVSLTYHRGQALLRCHHCGHWKAAPTSCPGCGGLNLIFRGAGTERAEEELRAILPGMPVIRMDADTTRTQGSHARHLKRFEEASQAVLLGTQMIAKGLDFGDVTLVGMLNADSALFLPDFRAAERSFQLLVQMSGRAGRGERPGKVIVQTYNPDHYAIDCFACGDYDGFFRKELAFREEASYPPFLSLVNVVISAPDARLASEAAVALRRKIPAAVPGVTEILGPAPAPIHQLKGRFRHHILIKTTKMNAGLRAVLAELKAPSRDISVAVDVDPSSIL